MKVANPDYLVLNKVNTSSLPKHYGLWLVLSIVKKL
jgi:hypothetical protein